jgi:CubicO group peptidase (beta-lactamase class C family)
MCPLTRLAASICFAASLPALWLPAAFAADDPYWPGTDDSWETVSPAEAGMDSDQLNTALAFAMENASHGVVVLRGGRIVGERYANGWSHQTTRDMFSAQKSVSSVLIGIALERGLIRDLDAPAAELLTEWKETPKAKITVKHLLSMTSGLFSSKRSDLFQHMRAKDKTAFALALDQVHGPGTRWAYNNPAYGLVVELEKRASGKSRQAFAAEALFDPLGMTRSRCALLKVGRLFEMTHHGLETSCRDMARFGLLVLRKGRWRKRQIVSAEYLRTATTPAGSDNPSYGYLWWLNAAKSYKLPYTDGLQAGRPFPDCPPDTIAALGAKDSLILVVPSLDLVVTRLGEATNRRGRVALSTFDNPFLAKVCAAVKPMKKQETAPPR